VLRGYEEKTCVGAAGGVGGSGDSKYHLKHVAADVIAMVDGLGVDTFHLCGHDWGRCVA
jgi:pimeloyl-ACP methyl ester carboxylesterase